MTSIKNIQRLQNLHKLIEQEVTGAPKELAARLHVSERLVYNLLEQLKEYEAHICYCRSRKTYYYCDEFRFKVNISVMVGTSTSTEKLFDLKYA